ncbi:MAG TPA: hypothetical protein PKV44_02035, partial [Bacillota bacterium]|nr:hypothetical protein [Bacillota bacterium]
MTKRRSFAHACARQARYLPVLCLSIATILFITFTFFSASVSATDPLVDNKAPEDFPDYECVWSSDKLIGDDGLTTLEDGGTLLLYTFENAYWQYIDFGTQFMYSSLNGDGNPGSLAIPTNNGSAIFPSTEKKVYSYTCPVTGNYVFSGLNEPIELQAGDIVDFTATIVAWDNVEPVMGTSQPQITFFYRIYINNVAL